MATSATERHHLHEQLLSAIDKPAAGTLMNALPAQPIEELATKTDLLTLRTDLHGETAMLRTDLAATETILRAEIKESAAKLGGEIADLCGEMAAMSTKLGGEITYVRGEMAGLAATIDTTVGQFKSEMMKESADRAHQFFLATLMAVLSTAALVLAAGALI